MKVGAFAIAVALLLCGCAASPKLADEQGPPGPALSRYAVIYAVVDAPPEVKEKPDYIMMSGRLLRSFVDGLNALGKTVTTSHPGSDNVLEARLTITDFQVVSTAARVLAGVLAGNAKLDVTLTLKDAATGAPVGVVTSTDSSTLLHGIFAADTERQIEATAKELATRLADVGTAVGARIGNAAMTTPARAAL